MIKMLMLVGALAAGGAMLHATYTNPGPITLSDLARSTDQGMAAANDAADKAGQVATDVTDKAGKVADTVSGAAQTGVHAVKSTAGFIGDTFDAGSRMVDRLKTSMTSEPAPKVKSTAHAATPGKSSTSAAIHARGSALDTLPEALVLPPAAAASAE